MVQISFLGPIHISHCTYNTEGESDDDLNLCPKFLDTLETMYEDVPPRQRNQNEIGDMEAKNTGCLSFLGKR